MKQKTEVRRQKTDRLRRGSAIILAIVLTTMLAIIGVLFLLSSRVDSVATSAVGGNQDLKLAVDTVVAQISEVLTRDVPGVDPNGSYYDYPDNSNPWLASLEPNYSGVWPHVTDLYSQLGISAYQLSAVRIYDHGDTAGNSTPIAWSKADADGDGASDSMWVQVRGKTSSKGKPIYAAIRIIDNGGMLNVNTGYRFDANDANPSRIDGSSQTQINLVALAQRPYANPTTAQIQASADYLNNYRCGSGPNSISSYTSNVVWQYGPLVGAYTPFDISDELEMRYRFVIDQNDTHTRLEAWSKEFPRDPYKLVQRDPFDNSSGANVPRNWSTYTRFDDFNEPNYAYRHLATTYNCDRIIAPDGNKMFNINRASVSDINMVRNTLRAALDPNIFDANYIAVNLIDYIDTDSNVTFLRVVETDSNYFGFETPCIYISEIAQNFYKPDSNSPGYDANNPDTVYRSYAIELFKPYWQDDDQNGWEISTQDDTSSLPKFTPIVWSGSTRFHVLANNNPAAIITIDFNEPNDANIIEPNAKEQVALDINFGPGTAITLYRDVNGYGRMPVDSFQVPDACVNGSSWMEPNTNSFASQSFERDIASIHRCIRKYPSPTMTVPPTIGFLNRFVATGTSMIQAHPANKPFTNVGEIGQLFRTDAYLTGPFNDEASVRLNIADANFQNLFNHLTVMDPYDHGQPVAETKIKGRININTAPWFVIAQLPWVSHHTQPNYNLARSIVNYRDTYGPFKNIGELMLVGLGSNDVNSIGYYENRGSTIPATLLTPPDGVGDAFEERDVIFNRISNLVTVRSDVFTAYILIRIGTDGPQKRVIAILDRSEAPTKPVKVIAIQPVPDPR